jgi:ATP sulfurylase
MANAVYIHVQHFGGNANSEFERIQEKINQQIEIKAVDFGSNDQMISAAFVPVKEEITDNDILNVIKSMKGEANNIHIQIVLDDVALTINNSGE